MTCTYDELRQQGIFLLDASGIKTARLDVELLMMECLGKDRSFLFLHGDQEVDAHHVECLNDWFQRRSKGEPLQYITGKQEFMGLNFQVSPAVLIPRQDTEVLAELALEIVKDLKEIFSPHHSNDKTHIRILDMCCGSGALAVSIAYYLQSEGDISSEITAVDISPEALKLAKKNAEGNNVLPGIRFIESDLFTELRALKESEGLSPYHLILSNPPYISTDVISTLQREVRDYEPMLALDGGGDGLDFYRVLAEESSEFLATNGRLIMEIGFDQMNQVSLLLNSQSDFRDISVHKDLAGLPRVVMATRT